MSSHKAIGGFFELELRAGEAFHRDAVALNSARSGFEYILRVCKPRLVYMPKYTCDVMLEPLARLNIAYEFYEINAQLELVAEPTLGHDELLVYTNYFGVKNTYSRQLSERFGEKLVVDCSQAFYYQRHRNEQVIYSPRKFFGVADGGYVIADRNLPDELPLDTSYQRMEHLLKRIDLGPQESYADFKTNDASLSGEPIKQMSRLTRALLGTIDYEAARVRRVENFHCLHQLLGDKNELTLDVGGISAPMVYPFMAQDGETIKQRLIQHQVFVATYWPNVYEWCKDGEIERVLAQDIVPLPIDQRYTKDDMRRIGEIVNGN